MQNQLPHSDEDLKSARYSGVALGIVITLLLGWILTLLDPMPPISSDDSSATGPVQVFIQMPPAPEESNASPNSEQSSATPTTDNPYYYSESEHNTSKTVEVYPAVGNKRGVISHGTSVLNDPSSDGKSYHCRKQYRQFTVTYLAQVEYNGTAVHYTEESDPDGQFYAIMYFDGENLNSFKAKVVSLIVRVNDDPDYHRDDVVINAQPGMFTRDGFRLFRLDIDEGRADSITFCMMW